MGWDNPPVPWRELERRLSWGTSARRAADGERAAEPRPVTRLPAADRERVHEPGGLRPGGAADLPVGDDVKPDFLLQHDGVTYRVTEEIVVGGGGAAGGADHRVASQQAAHGLCPGKRSPRSCLCGQRCLARYGTVCVH